ncbi:MAG: CoA-transferase [Candidatus Caldarchaeum sp.]|nr:CoA-transferase [Candidatus Caldarchaeum sp.]
MSSSSQYSRSELLAVLTARVIEDRKTLFVGVGIPMLAAALAQRLHAPNIVIVFEGGIIAPQIKPSYLPLSTNEVRAARRALVLPPICDVFFYQQRGYIDFAIIGGAQVDMYGNVNTSVIGDYSSPRVRLPGSGGANDIASTCSNVIISTFHERRRFVKKVDFITSPGYLSGNRSREQAGLIFGKPIKVVTDMAVMSFDDETKTMKVDAVLRGLNLETVLSNMDFRPVISKDVETIEPPTEEELMLLRQIDPDRLMLK